MINVHMEPRYLNWLYKQGLAEEMAHIRFRYSFERNDPARCYARLYRSSERMTLRDYIERLTDAKPTNWTAETVCAMGALGGWRAFGGFNEETFLFFDNGVFQASYVRGNPECFEGVKFDAAGKANSCAWDVYKEYSDRARQLLHVYEMHVYDAYAMGCMMGLPESVYTYVSPRECRTPAYLIKQMMHVTPYCVTVLEDDDEKA